MAGDMKRNGVQTQGVLCKEPGTQGGCCKTASSVPRRRRQLQLEKMKASATAAGGGVFASTATLKRVRDKLDSSSSSSSSTSSTDESSTLSPPSDTETATVEIEGEVVVLPPFPVKGLRCLSHGSVSVIGRRREMEDAVTVAPGFSSAYDFFGVYDGHGGPRVADVCRERLHLVLAEEAAATVGDVSSSGGGYDGEEMRWREAMVASFKRVDGEVSEERSKADASEKTVGSTAVVAVVGSRRIVVANCGDSRAVLSRAGVALPLSSDHKPDRPDEMERVEAAGGKVINWDGYRVLGVLATSRSIGDHYLKPYVISEPEVTVTDRTEKDEFLILASDGLWDVVSNEVACNVARRCLSGRAAKMFPDAVRGRSASEAAVLLAELAISRGSKDNITVVVVELKKLSSRRGW